MTKLLIGSVAGLALFAASAMPVFAASSEKQCTAAGGTYDKTGPVATCSYPVGNSGNVKTDTQKGSFESSHPEGYINPAGHMPAGQQGN